MTEIANVGAYEIKLDFTNGDVKPLKAYHVEGGVS